MPLDKKEYIKKFGHNEVLDDNTFWSTCKEIFDAYEQYKIDNMNAPSSHLNDLMNLDKVHSVRYRFKDSYHLIDKIVRKRKDGVDINVSNYKTKIQDLIGFRILHLFKNDCIDIHNQIIKKWDILGEIKVYYDRADDSTIFDGIENSVKEVHPQHYRSIHYIVEISHLKQQLFFEFQLRTIFEEAWSEVNHIVCYPNNTNNIILSPYMMILNRLAGVSDVMATNAMTLRKYILNNEERISELQKEKIEIEQLKDFIKNSLLTKEQQDSLLNKVDRYTGISGAQNIDNPFLRAICGAQYDGNEILKQLFADQSVGRLSIPMSFVMASSKDVEKLFGKPIWESKPDSKSQSTGKDKL